MFALPLLRRTAVSTAARALGVPVPTPGTPASGPVTALTQLQDQVLAAAGSVDASLTVFTAHRKDAPAWRTVVETAGIAVREAATGRGSLPAAFAAISALEGFARDLGVGAQVLLDFSHEPAQASRLTRVSPKARQVSTEHAGVER